MHAYMDPNPSLGKRGKKKKKTKQRAKQCISGEREFVWGCRVDGILEAMESGWRREHLLIPPVLEMGWKRNDTHCHPPFRKESSAGTTS